jgi:VIT1/CCC1 family predicted Fe2+/Mn2+ transporter
VNRGLDLELARQVATQLMAHDAIGAHARDELGISEAIATRPVQAALASAATFGIGAFLPMLIAVVSPLDSLIPVVSLASLVFLALLGALAAHTGGASILKGISRVTFWGALAMGLTSGIGALFGTVV